ncbi:hypothetical protein BH20ACT16_BH20ACT16_12970 [soil metagenome]
MNITRNARIATVAAIACAGLGTAVSTPAMAYSPVTTMSSGPAKPTVRPVTTLSNGPVKPTVKMTWSECWRTSYFSARDHGDSVPVAEATADLTCGRSPDEF